MVLADHRRPERLLAFPRCLKPDDVARRAVARRLHALRHRHGRDRARSARSSRWPPKPVADTSSCLSGADLAATFARVADELRRQYVIGFSPAELDGKLHRVEVRVGRAGHEGQGSPHATSPHGHDVHGCLFALSLCWLVRSSRYRRPLPITGASLVVVDVAVESDRRASRDRTDDRSDFEIITGGATRPIESFAASDRPLSLVLLFDTIASMESTITSRRAVSDGVREVVPALSCAGAIASRSARSPARSRSGPPIAGNPRALLTAVRKRSTLDDVDTFGPSPMWDAVDAAVAAPSPTRRPARGDCS